MPFLFLEKYGVIPKKYFPESHSSEASRRMNDILNHKVGGSICCVRMVTSQDEQRGNNLYLLMIFDRDLK